MISWYLLVSVVLFIALFALYYLCKNIYNTSLMKKINNKIIRLIISILLILSILLVFNVINSIVIILHLFIFISLTNIFFRIYDNFKNKKIKRKKYSSNDLKFVVGLCITVIYLFIGAYLAYHVFETNYSIYTSKDIGVDSFRIVQFADSHVGTTFNGEKLKKYIDKINKKNPDIVVITGDFIDDDTSYKDMIDASKSLSYLKTKYGVYFVNGNHDKGYYNNRGYSYEDLVNELEKNNVIHLEDKVIDITDNIVLVGRKDKIYMDRKSIDELVKDIDKDKYIIDLNHQPNDYENEKNKVDLVLSGHTHGGQLIPLGSIGVLTGANDSRYGLSKRGNTNYIVTSGISDWALNFKTGTKSEYVVIDITNKGE